MITVAVFKWVPPVARGLVRDLRVRWALEEAGLAYRSQPIGHDEKNAAAYKQWQPFGQVPAYEEDGLRLFESGAIVLHIAERSEALLPPDPAARARAVSWVFAALNTVESAVQPLVEIDLFHGGAAWAKERRPEVAKRVERRLAELAVALGERDYLEGRFTAGDLMMASVLRLLRHTELVAGEPKLAAYQARCEARPAFQRALAAQMADFES